jgi:hypothetical protein
MGWRFDFILKGKRYTNKWYDTEAKAIRAEARRKEKVFLTQILTQNSKPGPTDAGSLKQSIIPSGSISSLQPLDSQFA